VDLSVFLEEAKELIHTVVGRRIKLSTAAAPGTRRIVVDPGELQLALINLALNARDAMPSGGQLWMRAHNASPDETEGLPPGRYVLIAVSDEGEGIDESVIERVFEPFFTTKPMGKGTGLGLSQVRGFCAQAGGTARVASTPGIGTVVSLLLPAQGEELATAPDTQSADDSGDLSGRHVLMVEDNDELGEVTMALLESYGCRVQRCRSAEDALNALQAGYAAPAAPQNRFDVMLSDIAMPGAMDGVGLALTVRERWPELPVVLISGYSAAMERAREFIVLRKPCTPEDLVNALQRAMKGRSGK
jgi:CheY-like chemotaxis protein